MNVWHDFALAAKKFVSNTAIEYGELQYSYAQLYQATGNLQQQVRQSYGSSHETNSEPLRIAVFLEKSPLWVVCLLMTQKAGHIFIPLDPKWPEKRIQLILGQSKPHLILCDDATYGSCLINERTLTLSDTIFSGNADELVAQEVADKAGYLYFTSGSTGVPKGILGRTDSLAHFIRWQSDLLDVSERDKVSMLTNVGFDPVLRDTLLPLCNGATLVIPTNADLLFDPQATLAFLHDSKVTLIHQVPSVVELWLQQPESTITAGLSSVRTLMLAGEKLRPELAANIYALAPGHFTLYNFYGPTETTLAKFSYLVPKLPLPELKALGATIPVGLPISDTKFELRQAESVLGSENLSRGEVTIKTRYSSAGYWDSVLMQAHSFSSFGEDNWVEYETGDQGELNCNGDLVILGRLDKQIKINGQRVELAEIELACEQLESVEKAIVTYYQNALGVHHIYAHLIGTKPLSLESVQTQLSAYLPAHMIPTQCYQHERFEQLANGKTDRLLLLQFAKGEVTLNGVARLTFEQPDSPCVMWSREDSVAQTIESIWQSIFNDCHFDPSLSVFSLGGSSLQLVSILAQIKIQTGIAIPYAEFALTPTPMNLFMLYLKYEHNQASNPCSEQEESKNGLTPAQKGLVFTQQLYPTLPLYNMPYAITFFGKVKTDKLTEALTQLSRRDALSLSIDLDSLQWRSGHEPTIEYLEVENITDAKNELQKWASLTFDLEQGPLIKVMVMQSQTQWQLAVCAHHVLCDASKFTVLVENLLALYHQTALISPVEQYDSSGLLADYSSAKQFWLKQLEGKNTSLDLTGMQYNSAPFLGGLLEFELSQALSAKLILLAQQQQVSLNTLLFAAFQALLFKYSCQKQIITGLPFRLPADRQSRFNINPLPVVTDFEMEQSFSEMLTSVAKCMQTAIYYGVYPFVEMVSDLNLQGAFGSHPIFQSLFAYHENNVPTVYTGQGLVRIDCNVARYSLSADMWLDGSQLKGLFEYGAIAFDEFQASQIVGHFKQLLEQIVEKPNAQLSQLSVLNTDALNALYRLARVDGEMPQIQTIDGMIKAQAMRTPALDAVVYNSQSISYAQLETRATQWALELYRMGVRPNTRVGLSISRSIELVVGFYAILKLGAVYVPLDPDYPAKRREFIIEDTQMQFLLCEPQVVTQYQKMNVACLVFDESHAIFLSNMNGAQPLSSETQFDPTHTGKDVAYVIYTSGSTGNPKGVEVPHIGVCNLAFGEIDFLDMKAGSRVLQFASFSFDTSIWEIVMTLCSGGVLVMADKLAILPGPDLANTLLEQRISHVTLPASSLAALPYQHYADLSVIITAGEACAIDLLRLWGKGRRFVNSYGPTEASVSASNAELSWDDELVHIGHPLPNVQTWVLDSAKQLRPQGLPGELYVGGIGVAKGYLNRPELTEEKFVEDPFVADGHAKMYRTGDLVRLNERGQLEFLGRIDEQVKVRGFRIEPSEIETVLRQDAQIIDAKVIVKQIDNVPLLVAYISAGQHQLDEVALRRFLSGQLPHYMMPDRFVALVDFPRLPNNKVNVKALPEPQVQTTEQQQVDGDDPIVNHVTRTWHEFLAVERIASTDNFFSLGGNSLRAVSMMRVLSKLFSLDLGVSELFRYPTVMELAEQIKRLQNSQTPKSELGECQIEAGTWYPMTAAQQRMYYLQQLDENATNYNLVFCEYFKGSIDIGALSSALHLVLQRHAGLRCEFRQSSQGLEQRIIDIDGGLQSINFEGASERFFEECDAYSQTLRDTVWDLNLGTPLQITLLTDGYAQHAVIVGCHHILLDQEAWSRFRQDWFEQYRGLIDRNLAKLKDSAQVDVDYQIIKHALWQQHQRKTVSWQHSLEFWAEHLKDASVHLNLPIGTNKVGNSTLGIAQQHVGAEVQKRVSELAKQLHATEFNCWLGLFYAFLYRYCGAQHDITVLFPILGLSAQEDYVGLRLNTLALRLQCDGEQTLHQVVSHTRKRFLNATRHGQIPYEDVVDLLGWGGEQAPEVMFVYKEDTVEPPLVNVTNHSTALDSQQAKFPLTLFVESNRNSQGAICKWEYDSSRINEKNMLQLQAAWHAFLHGVAKVESDAIYLKEISIGEAPYQSPSFISKRKPYSRQWLVDKLSEAELQHSAKVALVQGEVQLSYAQAQQQSAQMANWLQRFASEKTTQRRCLILQDHSPMLVISIMAALKAGWCYIPVDPNYPVARLKHIIEDASPDIILTDVRCATHFALDNSVPWLAVDHVPLPWHDCSTEIEVSSNAQSAYIIYTSGSTGKPKGVEVGLASLAQYLEFARQTYLPNSLDGGMILHSSVGFDATITSLFLPWLTGRTLYIVDPVKPLESLCELFALRRYCAVKIAPAHLDVLRQYVPYECLGNAAHLIIGGDALHYGALTPWQHTDVVVFNEYGPTEATVGCGIFAFEPKHVNRKGPVPIGNAIPECEFLVLDNDGNRLPRGGVGELYIAGFGLAHGYVNLPEITAQKFLPHPFDSTRKIYQSGDLVKYNDADELVYLGRKDNQVKLAGHRIELAEIEACSLGVTALSDAVALLKDNEQGTKLIALYYVCKAPITQTQLRGKLSEMLPQYMIPAQFFELPSMPLTSNGKVDRSALLEMTFQGELSQPKAAVTPIMETLRTLWLDVLKLDTVSVTDNFFALGGDSIVSLQIIYKARELGLKITPSMMLKHQSIAQLATVVSLEDRQQVSQQEGEFPLTPILKWAIEYNSPQINHLNQSRILMLPIDCDDNALHQALLSVVNHHGMLRLTLKKVQDSWQAKIGPSFSTVQISEVIALEYSELDAWLELQQSRLDLEQQPWLVQYITLPDNQPRLLWVMHHAAVDHVSWQILLEDLNTAYQQIMTGQSPKLANVTCGYGDWARWCDANNGAKEQAVSVNGIHRLPLYDASFDEPLLVVDEHVITQTLNMDLYREDYSLALGQQTQQILLVSAIAQALREWAAIERVMIVNESHGRSLDELDVSRTVGWFTHFSPLIIDTSDSIIDTLQASRRHLASTAELATVDRTINKAVLEQAHICLNFLGKSAKSDSHSAFSFDPELFLPHQTGKKNRRGFILTLDVEATEQGLKLYWSHASHGNSTERVNELIRCFESHMNNLLVAILQPQYHEFITVCHSQTLLSASQFKTLSANQQIQYVLPANSMQKAMVFHSLHHSTAHYYHEQLCFDLPFAASHEQMRYRHCWQQLVDTHPMLRAKFISSLSAEPLLVIDSQVTVDWQKVTIENDTQLMKLLEDDKQHGFDLESAPLHRVYWIEQGESIKLLLVHHHGILDGWSVSLLLGQFTDLLNGKPCQGSSYALLPIQPPRPSVSAFWRTELAEFEHTCLPLDTLSALQQAQGETGHFISQCLQLSERRTASLKDIARKANVSINTLFQAAWALVLQRQQGHAKVCFGFTHAGRQPERGQLQQSIGLFIETLPLVIGYNSHTQLVDWLKEIQQHMGSVQHHAAELVELKVLAGLTGDSRLFDSLVVFENYPNENPSEFFVFDFANEKTEIPLTLVVSEHQGLKITFNYHSPSASGGEQLSGLIGQLATVLEQFAQERFSQPLAHFNTVPDAQQSKLLHEWQGKSVSLPASNVVVLFDEVVQRYPHHVAVSAPDRVLTYEQLTERSKDLAAVLLSKGVSTGDYVGICYQAHSDLLVAIMGVLRAGAAYIPIEPDYPAQRKQYMLEKAQARILLSDDGAIWCTQTDLTIYQVEDLLLQPSLRPKVWPLLSHTSPCYAIYTSGSTGLPKGVAVNHGALVNYLDHCQRQYSYPIGGIVPVTTSISFDATITSLLVPIVSGAQVQLFSKETQLIELANGVQAGRFCLAKLTPAHLDLIYHDLGDQFRPEIATLIVGGEALHRATCLPWIEHGTQVVNEYGPTEATVGCSTYIVSESEKAADVSIGSAIQNTELYVLSAQRTLLPIGAEGEIYIGGLGLAQGYINEPTLTSEKFVAHPFKVGERLYKTGDRAYFDHSGRLHYRGRSDEQVKVRGHRVELSDIEQNIVCHKAVAQAAVIVTQAEEGGMHPRSRIIAFIVAEATAPEWPVLMNDLKEFMANSLPDFMCPTNWQNVSELPLTANGKVDRKALLKLENEQPIVFLPPTTETEKKLANIWCEQLQVQSVGQQCSFFDLGGHSLKASQILARVHKEFNVKVPLSAFLRMPTLSALAKEIDKTPKTSSSKITVSSRRNRQ